MLKKYASFASGVAVLLLLGSGTATHAWAQNCLPGDNTPECRGAPARSDALDRALERPPQLMLDFAALPGSAVTSSPAVSSAGSEQLQRVAVPSGTPTWGAFAKDLYIPGVAGAGITNNWLTPEEAENDALQMCAENGGQNCFVEASYSNRCVGIALNEEQRIFWNVDVTPDMAAQSTIDICVKKSTTVCQIVYAGCSYPVP